MWLIRLCTHCYCDGDTGLLRSQQDVFRSSQGQRTRPKACLPMAQPRSGRRKMQSRMDYRINPLQLLMNSAHAQRYIIKEALTRRTTRMTHEERIQIRPRGENRGGEVGARGSEQPSREKRRKKETHRSVKRRGNKLHTPNWTALRKG